MVQVDVLLAIDSSTKETGWAVFLMEDVPGTGTDKIARRCPMHEDEGKESHPQCKLVETGLIVAHQQPWRVEVADRIDAIEAELDRMAQTWKPKDVACGKPAQTPLPHQQEWSEMLVGALKRWSRSRGLPLFLYPLREVRATLSGRANAAKEELAFVVMSRWGLLGMKKTTHEWNAIAVGDYHLGRLTTAAGMEN